LRERTAIITITIVSIVIPSLVALIFYTDIFSLNTDADLSFLPKFHATLNGLTAFILTGGYILIRKKKRKYHKLMMLTAACFSAVFLVSYVLFHSQTDSTTFGGEGAIKFIYYFILLSHILLAIAIVPLVLLTLYRALTDNFSKHKKIARITLPIWIYVAITGVVVYLMIAPYY